MTEKWAQIEGFEGFYEISDMGNVRSVERVVPRICKGQFQQIRRKSSPVKQTLNHKGYPEVTLSREANRSCFRVHRLVAAAFVSGTTREQVNHLNSIRTDNRAINLEWCSCLENVTHAIANDPNNWGKRAVYALLNGEPVLHFESAREAERHGFHQGNVGAAAKGRIKTYKGYKWVYVADFADPLIG